MSRGKAVQLALTLSCGALIGAASNLPQLIAQSLGTTEAGQAAKEASVPSVPLTFVNADKNAKDVESLTRLASEVGTIPAPLNPPAWSSRRVQFKYNDTAGRPKDASYSCAGIQGVPEGTSRATYSGKYEYRYPGGGAADNTCEFRNNELLPSGIQGAFDRVNCAAALTAVCVSQQYVNVPLSVWTDYTKAVHDILTSIVSDQQAFNNQQAEAGKK